MLTRGLWGCRGLPRSSPPASRVAQFQPDPEQTTVLRYRHSDAIGARLELRQANQGGQESFMGRFLARTGDIHELQEGLFDLFVRPIRSIFEQAGVQTVQQPGDMVQFLIGAQVSGVQVLQIPVQVCIEA